MISGTVTDEHGRPLHYANVIVKGAQIGGSTGISGNYMLLRVPVGTYTVFARTVGFDRDIRPGVRVREHKMTTVNFNLQPTTIDTLPPDWVD